MKIYIPYKNETQKEVETITESAGENILEKDEEKEGKININEADATALQELPGIGAATASKIVTYRKENRKIQNN